MLQEHGTGGFKRMYDGDGWAGQKVPGQSQDYTNTVQTERLRETLRKEQVRTQSVAALSSGRPAAFPH